MAGLIDSVKVNLLTGFLGSGKSTLLNALLRHPEMPPTAVMINEIGEVAVDHALVQGSVGDVTLLAGGCVCCVVRSDLEGALRDLHIKRLRGQIPPFERVILETTGLADPDPVLEILTSTPVRQMRYALERTLTTVDACHGARTLQVHPEAVLQAVLADVILMTKTDLAGPVPDLIADLEAINPFASILEVVKGEVSPALVLGQAAEGAPLRRRRAISASAQHTLGVTAHGRVYDGPFDWDALDRVLRAFLAKEGARVLRLKGVFRIAGIEHPVALQGVRRTLYPPEILESVEDGRSRLTVIGQDLPEAVVAQLLNDIATAQPAAG